MGTLQSSLVFLKKVLWLRSFLSLALLPFLFNRLTMVFSCHLFNFTCAIALLQFQLPHTCFQYTKINSINETSLFFFNSIPFSVFFSLLKAFFNDLSLECYKLICLVRKFIFHRSLLFRHIEQWLWKKISRKICTTRM